MGRRNCVRHVWSRLCLPHVLDNSDLRVTALDDTDEFGDIKKKFTEFDNAVTSANPKHQWTTGAPAAGNGKQPGHACSDALQKSPC